jgi:P-type Ca2+ transporter type 2C
VSGHLHNEAVESLLGRLEADPVKGLSEKDAQARLEKDGPNELPSAEGPSALKKFFAQFANPIVLTLLVAAVIATVNGMSAKADAGVLARFGDAIAIGLIVVLNAVLGYYQEQRAEQALDALKRMQTPTARCSW